MRAGGSAGNSIWIADADGQHAREILKAAGGLHTHWLRFSADGRWVAFCAGARDGEAREIIVVPYAPDRKLRDDEWISISDDQKTDREPFWSPDGRRLFFLSDRDGFRCIWFRPVDPQTGRPTGPAVPYAHFHHRGELLAGPMPSPESIGFTVTNKDLVFTVARSTGNLWQQLPKR